MAALFPMCQKTLRESGVLTASRIVPLVGGAIALAVAMTTRLPGFDSTPLWLDEAWRANLVLDPTWPAKLFEASGSSTVTTFGYAALSGWSNSISPSSFLLRLTSLLPSIASVAIMNLIVLRMTNSRVLGFCAALTVALNVSFSWHAKEFKPYSLELFLHLSLLFVALHIVQNSRDGKQVGSAIKVTMLVAPLIAALTMANVVFVLPGYYALLAIEEFKCRKKLPLLLMASGVVCLALLMIQYFVMWSGEGRAGLAEFWSADFYQGEGTGLVWIARRLYQILMASFATNPEYFLGRLAPSELHEVAGWIGGILVGAAALFGSLAALNWGRPERFLLIVLPIISVVFANKLMVWPLADVRPNLFLYGYFIALAFVGLSVVSAFVPLKPFVLTLALAWFGMVSFPDDVEFFRLNGPPREDVPRALTALGRKLEQGCNQPQQVLSTPAAFHGTRYYALHDAPFKASVAGRALLECVQIGTLNGEAYSDPVGFVTDLRARLEESSPIWIIWTHLNPTEFRTMIDATNSFATVDNVESFEASGLFRIDHLTGSSERVPKSEH